MNVTALSVPLSAAGPAPLEALATSSATDLDRLRSLIQSAASQTANPIGTAAPLEAATGTVPAAATRSFGDSILDGMLKFRSNYQNSIDSINTQVNTLATNEAAGLNDFAEIMALQINVSKWSMSVQGVDNASKAGANTVKELSRG
jgi:hypothetical protein